MKVKVTLRLDAKLLSEARILAAQEGTSVSRLLAERLEELVRRQKAYDGARLRALARLRAGGGPRLDAPSLSGRAPWAIESSARSARLGGRPSLG